MSTDIYLRLVLETLKVKLNDKPWNVLNSIAVLIMLIKFPTLPVRKKKIYWEEYN